MLNQTCLVTSINRCSSFQESDTISSTDLTVHAVRTFLSQDSIWFNELKYLLGGICFTNLVSPWLKKLKSKLFYLFLNKRNLTLQIFIPNVYLFYANSCQIIMCKSKLTTRQIQFRNVPVPEIHLLSIHLLQVSSWEKIKTTSDFSVKWTCTF